MGTVEEFCLENLTLVDKTILDAAVGLATSTYYWAKKIEEDGGTSKIIGVDRLDSVQVKKINAKLGELAKYVQLRDLDIFNMHSIPDQSVDIINCHHTIIFLNAIPLKILGALIEFRRVLKPTGILIITSENPIQKITTSNDEGQWRRWNLAKAIAALQGNIWASEPFRGDLERALHLLGFETYDYREFPAVESSDYQATMLEWKEMMLDQIAGLSWSKELKAVLGKEVDEVYAKVEKHKFLKVPGNYVIKCRISNRSSATRT
jgi:SAM-dependent methyltransferase